MQPGIKKPRTGLPNGGQTPPKRSEAAALVLLQATGFLLCRLPEAVLRAVAWTLGTLLYAFPSGRARIVRSNLHHAFPDRSRRDLRRLALESCRRTIEMGMFALMIPFLGERRLRAHVTLHVTAEEVWDAATGTEKPVVALLPHIGSAEAVTLIPLAFGRDLPQTGALYRPFDNPVIEKWIHKTRERYGVALFSRKEGYLRSIELLRAGGNLGILFDQNAGRTGSLISFFGRVASATDLPDVLARRFDAGLIGVFPRRTGFLRSEIVIEPITPASEKPGAITLAANEWLEQRLAGDDNLCASWLWLHDRWKTQVRPGRRFRLRQKRSHLELQAQVRGWTALPRGTRFWVRMPDSLGELVLALPLLRALRTSRPDVALTAVAAPGFRTLLQGFGLVEEVLPLPGPGAGYYRRFHRRRKLYPDVHIVLPESARCDREAWFTRCPQRFGIARPERSRALLTDTWTIPSDLDEARVHRIRVWEQFFRHFGLEGELDLSPLAYRSATEKSVKARPSGTALVGLICHSGGTPESGWNAERWRELIGGLLEHSSAPEILLFGTAADRRLTATIEETFPHEPVINLAGKTTVEDLVSELRRCRVVAGPEAGTLHLANALGLPVVALFGPGNPLRDGPVFDAPKTVLQPPGCPGTGGGKTDAIDVGTVLQAIETHLS